MVNVASPLFSTYTLQIPAFCILLMVLPDTAGRQHEGDIIRSYINLHSLTYAQENWNFAYKLVTQAEPPKTIRYSTKWILKGLDNRTKFASRALKHNSPRTLYIAFHY